MKKKICINKISGTLSPPTSKSVAQRAVIAAMLCQNNVELQNLTFCDDTSHALGLADFFNKEVVRLHAADVNITHQNRRIETTAYCGESGLLSRMMLAIANTVNQQSTISGCGSLLQRPFDTFFNTLHQLGVTVTSNNGKLPITLNGKLCSGNITVDGSLSSQFITGLLFALPLTEGTSELTVQSLKSTSYIDITIDVLKSFNIQIERLTSSTFRIEGGQTYRREKPYSVEGDWSGASCLLVAGAVGGEITLTNMNISSLQGDRAILDVLHQAGVKMTTRNHEITVYQSPIQPFSYNATDTPDLFPALAALAFHCNQTCSIEGIDRLVHKESNRAEILKKIFTTLGAKVELVNNRMNICGGKQSASHLVIPSYNDHRMAMAVATAVINTGTEVTIEDAECVNKSYPDFWNDLQSITIE